MASYYVRKQCDDGKCCCVAYVRKQIMLIVQWRIHHTMTRYHVVPFEPENCNDSRIFPVLVSSYSVYCTGWLCL